MRLRWFTLTLLLSCATPSTPAPTAPPPVDVPAHTQALMDAYRRREALRATAPVTPAQCPGDPSRAQLRERYLHAVDGCVDEPAGGDPWLDVAPRAQWTALYAALDARLEGVDRCIRHGYTFFELAGALVTRLELAADGTIAAVRTRDDASVPDVACCVRRELRRARLPAPGRPLALELVSSLDPATLRERYGGTLAKEAIRGVVATHTPDLRTCYEAAFQQGLSHGGRLTVRFVIAPEGGVSRAAVVDDGLGSPSAACCFVEKLRAWQFPRPEKGGSVRVTYPVDVQPGA
jgi:hypothetical protein